MKAQKILYHSAQGPSRTCNESKEEEEFRVEVLGGGVRGGYQGFECRGRGHEKGRGVRDRLVEMREESNAPLPPRLMWSTFCHVIP